MLTWRFEIDLARDYRFDDPLGDVSAWVQAAQWWYGQADSFGEVAPTATLRLDLDNSEGVFSPELPEAPYRDRIARGMIVRVRAALDGEPVSLWYGKVRSIAPTVGAMGEKQVRLIAEDQTPELSDADYAPPLQRDVTLDEPVRAIFARPLAVWPYESDYWLLGVPGCSELGTTTRLFGSTPTDLDVCLTRLPFVGDAPRVTQAPESPLGLINDIVPSEAGGRFYWNARLPAWTLHNRGRDFEDLTPDAEFTSDWFDAADYRFMDTIINSVAVQYQPRSQGEEGVIYRAANLPILIPILGSTTITARYQDPNIPSANVSAVNIIPPEPYTDYSASDNDDGTGDRTHRVGVLLNDYGDRADLTLVNNDVDDDIYINLLQIRGDPLNAYERRTKSAVNGPSLARYGRVARTLNAPYISSDGFAASFASYLVNRYGEPFGRFASVSFVTNKTRERAEQALARQAGDKVRIVEPALGHDGTYVIVGERHALTGGGSDTHIVTWILHPCSQIAYWLLGVPGRSELGVTTRLFF